MSEIPGPSPGWERREPPDYDWEPNCSDKPIDDEFDDEEKFLSPAEMKVLQDLLNNAERVDGAGEADLFKNVVVTSSEGELKFETPPRIVETAEHGRWVLNVRGKRQWFKERADYGEIRTFTDGSGAIWVPHLFAFESIDEETSLPLVRDRERLNVEVTLRRLPGIGRSPYPMAVRVDTLNGEYGAVEDIGLSYGSAATVWFVEFVQPDGVLAAYDVEYPDVQRPSLTDYLESLEPEEARKVLEGQQELPPEFRAAEREISQQKSDVTGTPFGGLWVPVDTLRRGEVYAKISFPNFQ